MKRFRVIFFVTILLIINEKASSCDSTRVVLSIDYFPGEEPVYSHYSESWTWDSTGTVISWFKQDQKTVIAYNQFGQISSTEIYNLSGGNYVLYERTENYYSISNKDSLQLTYNWSTQTLTKQKIWTYDLNDNIVFFIEEQLQGASFDTTQMILTHYPTGLPDVIRIDSIFSGTPNLYYETLHAYTNLGSSIYYRIYESGSGVPPDYSWSDQFFSGEYHCGVLSGTTYLSPITQIIHYYFFDNQCRIIEYDHPSSTGQSNSHYEFYYYGDCNHMIILMNSDRDNICRGDSINISANVFAGTPPYHFNWTPNTFLTSDSDSTTIGFPQDTTNYILTVSDSLGHIITDTLKINVAHINPPDLMITNIDSSNGCYSADLSYTRTIGASYRLSRNNGISYWDPPPIHVVYNSTYILEVTSDECPLVVDSIVLNSLVHPSPYLTLTEGCNELFASSPTATTFNWHVDWPPVNVLYQGAVLPVDSDEHYICLAVDSLGCISENSNMWGRRFYMNTYFNLKCNDSCNSIGVVDIYPDFFHQYDILWSNGDSLEYTATLCDGIATVTVTSEIGCVLTETSDTCTNSVEEIDNSKIQLYPVPAHSEIKISLDAFDFPFDVFLTDITGRIKSIGKIYSHQSEFALKDVNPGTYVICVIKENQIILRKKLIVY